MTSLPATEATLCYFVACLGQQGLAHSTIRTYLSGVRQFQIAHSYKDLDFEQMPRLCQIIKGVKVRQGQEGRVARPRLPITPRILRLMKEVWFPSKSEPLYDSLMLWAAATTAFFGFCRSGEITTPSENKYDPNVHLSLSDISTDNAQCPSMLSIKLKQSKTDQERKGVKIIIGATTNDLCPITAILNFLKVRGSHPGPLFCWQSGSPLSKPSFVDRVRSALTTANLPADNFAGHSFRIGAATTAASAGICDSSIQSLGRWKSNVYLLHIRTAPQQLARVSASMLVCNF